MLSAIEGHTLLIRESQIIFPVWLQFRKDATEGMLTETFAYTELSRLYQAAPGKSVFGVTSRASTCGDYELDFVVVDKDDVRYGLEVKSGNNRAKSLEYYRDKGMVDKGFRVHFLMEVRDHALQRYRFIRSDADSPMRQ